MAQWLDQQVVSVRAYRALEKLGVERPEQLEGLTAQQLLRLPNVGKVTVAEVAKLALRYGYRMELPIWVQRVTDRGGA